MRNTNLNKNNLENIIIIKNKNEDIFDNYSQIRAKTSMNKSNVILDNKEDLEKARKIMSYNDEELNNLEYELALKLDTRSYCLYYISLLKTKHNLIFTFFNNNDYNSKLIKINIYFYSVLLYITRQILFFLMITQCIKYMKIKAILILYINFLKLYTLFSFLL